MKTIRYAFWGLVALVLVLVGLANRDIVTLRAMPQAMADLLHISPDIQLPLFVAIFAGVGIGLLIGFLWEWMREHPVRKQARRQGKEAKKLRQELATRSDGTGHSKDDVLALVERS
ncbi:LapA family protein [Marivivens donghaensis]|uniref:LapA family protein n=1 Tax=Marivivens donghaensis TaxID=1699413 RepID=A0ABX0VVP3_9RHOB|nr:MULTISPECIES: LapA family protein [Marivivens]NIY71884.1 LapA family protein [Marivivens donghaensis]